MSSNSKMISEKQMFRYICGSPNEYVALDERSKVSLTFVYKTIVSLGQTFLASSMILD